MYELAGAIDLQDFIKVDLRVGRIASAEEFPQARKPAYRLTIDFGPLGLRRSSAQITDRYTTAELVGRLVIAVFNLPPRQIASFVSEVLVLGVPDERGQVVLLRPDSDVPLGGRVY